MEYDRLFSIRQVAEMRHRRYAARLDQRFLIKRFLGRRMARKSNLLEIDEHTRLQCLRVVPDQNLDAEVQQRRFPMEILSRPGEPPLTLGPHFEAFLQKEPFIGACIITQHLLTVCSPVKEILTRQLGIRKFSRHSGSDLVGRAYKVSRVEASIERFKIRQESEVNDFEGIATGGEFWFQHISAPPECRPIREQIPVLGRGTHSRQWKLWRSCSPPQRN
jgi:hypothetical protein